MRSFVVVGLTLSVVGAVSCAAGNTGRVTSAASSSSVSSSFASSSFGSGNTTSSSSGGGAGGEGGAASTSSSSSSSTTSSSGAGGTGGMSAASSSSSSSASSGTTSTSTTSSTSSTSTTSSSSTSSSSSSGTTSGTVLLLGASTSTFIGGSIQVGVGSWTTQSFGSGSSTPPTLTADAAGDGVGVVTPSGTSLQYTIWHGGTWSTPANIVQTGISVMSVPSIDANNGAIGHLTYQDASYKYWYVGYTGSWSAPQAIGSGTQAYGPFASSIAALGTNATVAFFDGIGGTSGADVNWAATSDLVGGAWQPTVDLAGGTIVNETHTPPFVVPPVIVPLGGTDVLLAYVDSSNTIHAIRRTGGTWGSAPAIPNAFTTNYMAMAALPNAGAILGFRGTDGTFYWSLYSGGLWSTVQPFSTPTNLSIDGTPALSHGVSGDVAELAYTASGVAYHARLSTANTWSTPVVVGGGNLVGVALASTP